jgi:Ankyrin repeats (3 copies)
MESNPIPSRPLKVRLALYILYTSLGISVTTVLVAWLRSGFPGPVGYWLINVVLLTVMFHVHAQYPTWVWYGGLLNLAIVPIAVWFYFMIGKGKNWARITLLALVILETLDSVLSVVASLALSPAFGRSRLNLANLLTSTYALQTVLRIVALTLLFGGTSSDWFKAVKVWNQTTRTRGKMRVVLASVGLLGILIASVGFWQAGPWFRDRALIDAIRRNQVKKAQELLPEGASVNAKNEFGTPAIVLAAGMGRVEMVKLLLKNGANIDTRTDKGQTSLMRAAWTGQDDTVRLLLDNGADINARSSSGQTALMNAAWTGKEHVVKILVERGADLNAKDSNGETALMKASRLPIIELLLNNGADINAKDNDGGTALMKALNVSPEVVKLLLERARM